MNLTGGAITSTAAKEQNDLTTNSLNFSNIENQSSYQASTVALSGGTQFGKETKTDNNTGEKYTNNVNWRDATTFSPNLPQHEQDKDSSTTYATLSEGNITVGGKATSTTELGIHSDAATANRQVDSLPNLQAILDKQKDVADATSTIVAATQTYTKNKVNQAVSEKEEIGKQLAKELPAEEQARIKNMTAQQKDKYFANNTAYAAALANEKTVTAKWGIGGDKSRAMNAVTMAITGALGGQSNIQVMANSLAPYAAQQIGDKFGHGEDKNTAAQLVSHAILGAALAYVNGGNPAAGGSAAVASEAAASYLAERYNDGQTAINPQTGQFDPNLLPESVKSSIRDLTSAIGAVVGGTVGDSAFNAQLAGVVSQNAVENNALVTEKQDGEHYYTKEDIKYNLVQYWVATGQLKPEQVPDSIFEDMAKNGYILVKGNAEQSSPTAEDYKQTFYDQIKNGTVYSQEEYAKTLSNNSNLLDEINAEIAEKNRGGYGTQLKDFTFSYVIPPLQMVGGFSQIAVAGTIDVVGCASVVACGLAVTGSSFLIVNGLDDVRTGWNNFGASSNNQTSSSTLTSLGVSEGTSEWIKLSAGGASLATEALVINQGLKATTSTVGNIANVSDNSAQRGVLGENAGASQAKEVIEGGSGQAIAGHGYYQYGSGDVVIPSGTSVITSPYGVKISDGTGRFLENIDTTAFINADSTARIQMAKDWIASQPPMKERLADRIISEVKDLQIVSSGSQIPNYTVAPPSNLIIYQNSTTVLYPTQLDDLLKPNAGCIALGTCTEVKR